QVITIMDTTAPVWTTAADALDTTIECSDAAGLAAAQAKVPEALDNCDTDLTPVKVSGTFEASPGCPQAGTYTNTWTVMDACGNVAQPYTQVITIIDTTAPVWTTAADALDRTVECSDAAGLAAAQALLPEALDNCDGDVTNINKISGLFESSPTCAQAGTYTNTWTVTDECGNRSEEHTSELQSRENRVCRR